jgi:ribonucleoside-diphosphate reductase alpha chain
VEPELVASTGRRSAAASRTTPRSHPPARSRCRWPTTRATASSRAFAHQYSRNVIREGKKSKEKIDVFSYELLAYRELVNPQAVPYSSDPDEQLPEYFLTSEDITPKEHVDIQAAAQKWVDSSISKTINVPTDIPFDDFKDIYFYAYQSGLKGCTTFRFNPEAFQGVLVKEKDLEKTTYQFKLEDGIDRRG